MRVHQVENLKHVQNSAKVFLTPLHSAILVAQEHHRQALVCGSLSFRGTAGDQIRSLDEESAVCYRFCRASSNSVSCRIVPFYGVTFITRFKEELWDHFSLAIDGRSGSLARSRSRCSSPSRQLFWLSPT